MPPTDRLTPTSYALLGQLALRQWSGYEMTQNVRRTLHWFWPRAESVLYAELRRLRELGYAEVHESPGRRGRPQAVYSITETGRRELERWLDEAPQGSSLHSEPVLRVHLAPYGTKPDLVNALERARDDAEGLLRLAVTIGGEFAEARHQFQDQVHVRAILFEYLWSYGLATYRWATSSLDVIDDWTDLAPTADRLEVGRERIEELIRGAPDAITSDPPSVDDPAEPQEHHDRAAS